MQNNRAFPSRNCKSDRRSIVYTKDNVPVYKLTISKLPRNLKSVRIKQHFAKFGEIINVEILYGKTRSISTQCIIHYQKAADAGAALKQKYHTINRQRLSVKACPSWEQPYLMEDLYTNYNVNFLTLNDYCLEMIFQQLDLRQKLRLSLCHPRLEKIFTDMICPRLPRNLYLEELLQYSTWELRQFFINAAIYMERLVIAKQFPSFSSRMIICSLMQECDLRIKSVHIIEWLPWKYTIFLVSLHLTYISELELYKCNITDNDLQLLLKLRNLKTLGLAGNYRIQGIHLKYFRKLQRLSLCGCESITNDTLSECCRYLQLSYLDIRFTDSIRITERAVELCNTLDTLKLSCFVETVAKLPTLRSLEVHHSNSPITTSFYNALVEHHADNLLELKLTGQTYLMLPTVARIVRLRKLRTLWLGDHIYNGSKQLIKLITSLSDLEEISLHYSIRIRDKHLIPLITKCTKLKRINLRMCQYITNNFIWSTLEILTKRATATTVPGASQNSKRTTTIEPLIILVYGTRIKTDILESSVYRKNCHLLKLLFHADDAPTGLANEGSPFDFNDSEYRFSFEAIDVNFMNYWYGEPESEGEESSDSENEILY
uniref:Heterogeneous nuclear ribonucleoprotein C n=1 Tax=Zeugodacus cucurbitae TaxID=28588 RepID=A0A0A1XEK2_ZEUCU